MLSTDRPQSTAAISDEALLQRLGYTQTLYREFGGFSNFAISFTIISVLAGCLTSYYISFNNGGPAVITWGWLLVGGFCVLVAMAMGEIASAMPTAGALYYWASKLGGPAWGWFTGWFNLIGQIAVTAAIDYGAAIFTTALLNLWFPDIVDTSTTTVFIVYTVIMALHLGLNLANVNVLSLLNSVSAWWHMAGVALIVVVLTVVPRKHQSVEWVFTQVINNSGFSDANILFVCGLGLLMAQYTITGFDASAHMSEETRSASRSAAVGMVASVAVSVVFGFALLVAVTFVVTDPTGTAQQGQFAVTYIWRRAMGDGWAEFLLLIAVIAQLFCGTASVTSASRMMFAFSRDRAVPFSHLWRRVSGNRVPTNSVIAICVLAWALMIPTLANGAVGYAVGTSVAVIGLYIAFALPIILRIRAGRSFEPGAWSLGEHYRWISVIAVVWIAFMCVLFLLPISPRGIPGAADFSWDFVNYAPITVFGALALFGGWYFVSARHWFTGPMRDPALERAELRVQRPLSGRFHPEPPERREGHQHRGRPDEHGHTTHGGGRTGPDPVGRGAVPQVGQPRPAGHHDDEHPLHAATHLVGGHRLQHRRAEDRAHHVAGAGDREERDGEEHRAGEPEHRHAAAPDGDRHGDRHALPADPREPPGEQAGEDHADRDGRVQRAEGRATAHRITEPDLRQLREHRARHPEPHRHHVDEERHQQHLVHRGVAEPGGDLPQAGPRSLRGDPSPAASRGRRHVAHSVASSATASIR